MVNTQIFVLLFLSLSDVRALPDGLHPTPPMGWTSWNTFFEENSQDKMISQVRSQGVWRLADQISILCPDWCLVRAGAWQVWLHLPDHWWLLAAAWEGPRHSEDGGRSIEVRVILKSNEELNKKQKLGSQMASNSSLTTCTARDSASVFTAAPAATLAQVWDGNQDSGIQPIKLK